MLFVIVIKSLYLSLFSNNKGFNVSCFDISEEAINRTKQWCEEENLKCNYKVGDMLLLPYKDNSFDNTDFVGYAPVIEEVYQMYVELSTDTEGEDYEYYRDLMAIDAYDPAKITNGESYKYISKN